VNDVIDIYRDPHVRARGMLVEVEQPGIDRKVTIAGTPIHMLGTPGGVKRRSPLLGEHTDEVLAEFGFSREDIDALKADKVVI
jgi:formyl-CoA transferase